MLSAFSPEAWARVWAFRDTFLLGLWTTVSTAVLAILLAFSLGLLFGLFSTGKIRLLRVIARVYVEIIQNTPIVLQLCFMYYALVYAKRSIGIAAAGILALGIYHGAYMAEVIRAGIEAIPKGQFEAAQSQGFSYIQQMGYIILPQSVKVILPPMVNQVVNLIKNPSCLYIIGGADLISQTYSFVTGASTGGAYGPAYIVCGVMFFCVCFPLSRLAGRWEERLKVRDRRAVAAVSSGPIPRRVIRRGQKP